jgi:hypothetical protein
MIEPAGRVASGETTAVRIVAVGDGHELTRIDHDSPVRAVAFRIEERPAAVEDSARVPFGCPRNVRLR